MYLDRVTITGADDTVQPEDLLALSKTFPFVEWGVLVSASSTGSPRFPSLPWVQELQKLALKETLNLSLHVCGRWVRGLLMGELDPLVKDLACGFQRAQLNFHAETLEYKRDEFLKALNGLADQQIIFQIDNNLGETFYAIAGADDQPYDVVPLYDLSHGAGVLPKEGWPAPLNAKVYTGYAGGLGPDNLQEQIPLIGAAAGNCRIWIDMETRVRSDRDRLFDLDKVRRCLQIAAPFVVTGTP